MAKASKKKEESLGEIASLDQIKKELLKKAKASEDGKLEESVIYDELEDYELDDDTLESLMTYFRDNGVVVTDEDSEEDINLDELDDSDIDIDDDVNDYVDDEEEGLEEELDIDKLEATLGGEVKINDSVKIYLKEIGK